MLVLIFFLLLLSLADKKTLVAYAKPAGRLCSVRSKAAICFLGTQVAQIFMIYADFSHFISGVLFPYKTMPGAAYFLLC